jgi:hypothetical protein
MRLSVCLSIFLRLSVSVCVDQWLSVCVDVALSLSKRDLHEKEDDGKGNTRLEAASGWVVRNDKAEWYRILNRRMEYCESI